MRFINDLINDFKFNFLSDTQPVDIVLVILMIVPLLVTFFSLKIAEKFKKDEKDIMNLSLKIKGAALVIVAVLAFVITQV